MEKYRQGVGALILNKEGKVFVGQRNDIQTAWQMPQGGVDNTDESLEFAALREVEEETKIPANKLEVIGKTTEVFYNFPNEKAKTLWGGDYIGQKQVWFAFNFLGNQEDIKLKDTYPQEFVSYKWVEPSSLLGLVVDFKKDMYKEIIKQFEDLGII